MNGILSFSATASNPTAQFGVFHVSGGAAISGVGVAAMWFEPGAWIEQPTRFNATGLEFVISQGFIAGKPTMGGCASLTMHRVPD